MRAGTAYRTRGPYGSRPVRERPPNLPSPRAGTGRIHRSQLRTGQPPAPKAGLLVHSAALTSAWWRQRGGRGDSRRSLTPQAVCDCANAAAVLPDLRHAAEHRQNILSRLFRRDAAAHQLLDLQFNMRPELRIQIVLELLRANQRSQTQLDALQPTHLPLPDFRSCINQPRPGTCPCNKRCAPGL
jgi:hypothetical protein